MSSDNITAKSVLTQMFQLRLGLLEETHHFQQAIDNYLTKVNGALKIIQKALVCVPNEKMLKEIRELLDEVLLET